MRRNPMHSPEKPLRMIVVGVPMVAALGAAMLVLCAAQADGPEKRVSLLQTLSEWKYPGSTMRGGASMSDGGNRLVQSVKCKAILTTPDPIEKVIAFYSEKLDAPRAAAGQDVKAEVNEADAKSVTTQDDSQDRPVTLRVIVVNKADTSTTLVISRAAGEKETHVAWLHYIRLEGQGIRPAR